MTKDELKALGLTDEQVESVIADYGKNYVPKSQFNEKNEVVKQLKEEQKKHLEELENLKKANADNQGLAKQIEELKEARIKAEEETNKRIAAIQVDNAIEQNLLKARARNTKAVKALLDLDKVILGDDGKIIGLDEQLDVIKKDNDYLFESDNGGNIGGVKPADKGAETTAEPSAQDIFNKALGI